MRKRQPVSYAEDGGHSLGGGHAAASRHQASPQPNTTPYSNPTYYSGRLIEKQYAHPAHNKLIFNPNQAHGNTGGGGAGGSTLQQTGLTPKPPKQPEKPIAPNVRFGQKVYDSIKAERPKLKTWEVTKEANQMYRNLSPEERQPYIDEYEAAKIEYNEQIQAYHNSPAYQAYTQFVARSRAQAEQDAATDGRFHGADLDELYSIEPAKDPSKPRHPMAQALETQDDELNLQELASKRFKRNHDLMHEIFDGRCVNAGWAADEALTLAALERKFDTENVSGRYMGAGSVVAGLPSMSQIQCLKDKTAKLQELVKQQQNKCSDSEKAFEKKKEKYQKRTQAITKAWSGICSEKPADTYKKWKDEHNANIAELKRQKEAKTKQVKDISAEKPSENPSQLPNGSAPPTDLVAPAMKNDAIPERPPSITQNGPTTVSMINTPQQSQPHQLMAAPQILPQANPPQN